MTAEEDYEKNLRDYVMSTQYTHELIMRTMMRLANERNISGYNKQQKEKADGNIKSEIVKEK